MDVREFLSAFKLGETVLVEHSSRSRPELLFYQLVVGSSLPVVVDDIMDTLCEYLARLKLAGFNTSPLEEISVVKAEGFKKVGNVIGKIEMGKYVMDVGEYNKILSKVGEGPFVNPVIGMHKMFLLGTIKEGMRLVKTISEHVGNERRVAFYFLNIDALKPVHSEIIALLEEIATSVVVLEGREVRVVKTIKEDLEGRSLRF
ncbi:DUF257 family protein [Pyrococcus yayanosii]|nr:DUF257 family protein [Pyrococcus yayanosii]